MTTSFLGCSVKLYVMNYIRHLYLSTRIGGTCNLEFELKIVRTQKVPLAFYGFYAPFSNKEKIGYNDSEVKLVRFP